MRKVRNGRCLFPLVAHQVHVHLLEPLRRPCARIILGCDVETPMPLPVEGRLLVFNNMIRA